MTENSFVLEKLELVWVSSAQEDINQKIFSDPETTEFHVLVDASNITS